MSKSKQEKIQVNFCGENAQEVTGSMTLITIPLTNEKKEDKILIECGLRQSSSKLDDYKINQERFKFKAKDISYCFIAHQHIDHIGRIPLLVKRGFNSKIIVPKGEKLFIEALLKDSQYILERDSIWITKKKNTKLLPLYDKEDIEKTMNLIQEYDFNTVHKLNDHISFEYIHSGHIINSASIVLYLKNKTNNVTKIFYTSDLGNVLFQKQNDYLQPMETVDKCNYVISESTYADKDRLRYADKKERYKDIEKIKTGIRQTCYDNKGRVLFPSFSLGRSQQLLTLLYKIYGNDEDFNIPIYVDSPLMCTMFNIYSKVLERKEDIELFNKVCNWKNVKFIRDADSSKLAVSENQPCICIASGGFLTGGGRAINWARKVLPRENDILIFTGYGGKKGSVVWRIKHCRENKTISIEGVVCKNKASVLDLHSFSSHIQHNQLLELLSKKIQCDKIFLVHGNMDSKIDFAKELKEELEKNNKTTQVCIVNKGTKANL